MKAAKTLIIAGTYKQIEVPTEFGTRYEMFYSVGLFGQTPDRPTVECIGFIDQQLKGFDDLQDVCRERFCQYFNTDLNNIVSMETLHEAK